MIEPFFEKYLSFSWNVLFSYSTSSELMVYIYIYIFNPLPLKIQQRITVLQDHIGFKIIIDFEFVNFLLFQFGKCKQSLGKRMFKLKLLTLDRPQ